MRSERPEKKSETMRVRVPWSLKRDFLARARAEDRTASDIFRELMETWVRRPAQRTTTRSLETVMTTVRNHPRPAFAAAAIAGAAGLSALLTSTVPAGAAPDLRAVFDRLDKNGDGVVTKAEFTDRQYVRAPVEGGAPDPASLPPPDTPYGLAVITPAPGDDESAVRVIAFPHDAGSTADPAGARLASLARDFAAADANGDHQMTFEEYATRQEAGRNGSFDLLDANGDGAVDPAEIAEIGGRVPEAGAALQSYDSDGDGRLTRAEYQAGL